MSIDNYAALKKIFKRLSHLHYIHRIMSWDEAVMMPEGAGEERAAAMATLSGIIHKLLITKKTQTLIEGMQKQAELSAWDQANFYWMKKKYLRAACIPASLTEEMTSAAMASEQAWRKLRGQNNWLEFVPYFERTFKLVKAIAERKSQALSLDPYDALIDEYAPGFNQNKIDSIFAGLKNTLPELISQIINKQKNYTTHIPVGPFSIEKQKSLGLTVMHALKFNFNHGRLDVSHHPFCGGDAEDVRITTRYKDNDFLSSLMGICHETGHGLYEQGLPRDWIDQPVGKIDSMAMHESQSLLIEMEVCRSLSYFEFLTPLVIEQFGYQDAFSAENLFKLMTQVKPSLIRVDADEVTYPLHVILRYEIEKNLLNGNLKVIDLPAYWNEMMMKYLGIPTLGDDKNGVMQDVHWPAAAFGYFPAYTLGRLIAAQLFATFQQAHPQFANEVKHGKFQTVIDWLKTHVYSYAASMPTENWLLKITGAPLDSNYFIDRIKQRYLS